MDTPSIDRGPEGGLFFPCRGSACDNGLRCITAGGCQYKSSADEAREVRLREMAGKPEYPIRECCGSPVNCYHNDGCLVGVEECVDVQDTLVKLFPADSPKVRTFETGATRDQDDNKLDYEGFLSPVVLKKYAEYMHKNRVQSDGSLRSSDNWQKGIPKEAYMKSMWRHFMSVWTGWRSGKVEPDEVCALLFNVMGLLFELLRTEEAT